MKQMSLHYVLPFDYVTVLSPLRYDICFIVLSRTPVLARARDDVTPSVVVVEIIGRSS